MKGCLILTPDEVCSALTIIGANVSRRTLLHYEEAGLIPTPQRGGGGRPGRYTDYPEWTVEEAYAAWSFIHGKYGDIINSPFGDVTPRMPPSAVKVVRDLFYSGKKEESRTQEDINVLYRSLREQADKNFAKYLDINIKIDNLKKEEIHDCLYSASFKGVDGMRTNTWGYLLLWEAERLKARALLLMKKIIM